MIRFERVGVFVLGLGLAIPAATAGQNKLTDAEKKDGFVLLFDGKSLDNWTAYSDGGKEVKGDSLSFSVVDGEMSCSGKGGDYWIRHADQFGDFVFRLQYKLAPKCNSGIFLRVPGNGRPAWTSFEVQLLDDYVYGKATKHTSGSIFDVVAPTKNVSKPPGKWNDVEITCKGKVITCVWNGEEILKSDFSKFTKPIGKFKIPYAELPVTGYLGLQNHGGKIAFRNIRIKKLD